MKACARCSTSLNPIQVYRGNRFCSVRCANARGHGLANLGNRWCGLPEWRHVLALLGPRWYVTLADIAILRYGEDTPATIAAARESIRKIRRAGYALEWRQIPWATPERESIRGYRLATASAVGEGAA